jgi:hypothetical protein
MVRARTTAALIAALLTVAATASWLLAAPRASVAALAAAYVADYQRQLTSIVADELYVQEIRAQTPADAGAPRTRTLRGEVFFIFAAAEREWMAIRDVREVDGQLLAGAGGVRETLRALPAGRVAERMKSHNAKFNLGRITRNINEPTLALLVLDESHRSRFKFKAGKPREGESRQLTPLAFQERERPTLIRSHTGAPIFVSGELHVEPDTGRIWRSRLRATVEGIRVELTTEYTFDARLDLLLPSVFEEEYERGRPAANPRAAHAGDHELIVAEARYSNFRRFEVSSRIR